jgi:hypothetical protein
MNIRETNKSHGEINVNDWTECSFRPEFHSAARCCGSGGKLNNKQRNKMKKTSRLVIALLALGASAWIVTAQDNGAQQPPDGNGPPPGGPGGHRPPPPVITALDLNADGEIDAGEIAQAAESLKKLDKNADRKLTQDELRPPPPPDGFGGPGEGGPRGPRPGARNGQ